MSNIKTILSKHKPIFLLATIIIGIMLVIGFYFQGPFGLIGSLTLGIISIISILISIEENRESTSQSIISNTKNVTDQIDTSILNTLTSLKYDVYVEKLKNLREHVDKALIIHRKNV
ncbi:hypothetical protein SDC9_40589 [bioreactor metagenome]|uniref:Uncharacterized protein n=1 Tax=bioreactor metagenome TaxID=1076179 RepID=A0A644VSX7_9ZZZZ|nr:hypothetical protein [Methanobrevibacter sp.]MEA4957123.1 hypothetical protein [Methanobrevibacter sp.]